MKVPNPEFKKRVKKYLNSQHFMKLIGFELLTIEAGRTFGRLPLKTEHMQQTGLVHGGVTATLADIVCGFAAYTIVPESHHVVTAELRISYLRPGKGPMLEAEGRVLKSGKNLIFCESDIWVKHDHRRELIVKASAVMATVIPSGKAR